MKTMTWFLFSRETACRVGDLDRSLGQEDALEKGMATHSSGLLENPMDREVW